MASISHLLFKFIYFIIIITCCSYAGKEYGPYQVVITKVAQCRGPKLAPCQNFYFAAKKVNTSSIQFQWNAKEVLQPFQLKAFAYKGGKQILSLYFKNLCENALFEGIYRTLVGFEQSKNCVIPKGFFFATMDINYAEHVAMKKTEAIFGEYSTKFYGYYEKCNLFCLIYHHVKAPLKNDSNINKN